MSVLSHLKGRDTFMSDSASFRRVYEDHLELIRARTDTQKIPVNGKQLDVHQFNWIGLLNELGQPQSQHWFIIRLNNSANWVQIPKDMGVVLVPNAKYIASLYSVHVSSTRNARTI